MSRSRALSGAFSCVVLLLSWVACHPADVDVPAAGPAGGKADKVDPAPQLETEIKIYVSTAEQTLAFGALGLAGKKEQKREISYYDTLGLELYQAGLILRARDKKGKDDDSTVKLRPMDPAQVDPGWYDEEEFKCEEDRSGAKSVVSCSLTVEQGEDEIDEVADGDRPVDKLFSNAQEALIDAYAAVEVPWQQLAVLGPVKVRRWTLKPDELDGAFAHKVTVEEWQLPETVLELSIKVPRSEADAVQADFRTFVASLGLDPDTPPASKTRLALEHFAPQSSD